MVPQDSEELAGHVGAETRDPAGGDPRPLGVGAGQDEAGVGVQLGPQREGAGDLGLLAPHDVGTVAPVQDAGHDPELAAGRLH